ncbi:MAG: hypothetical protein V5B39_13845 [Accumulibacter sp.]|jgi:hypothetical protein|uniref:hypothetical protein n=1 Tax=Accumulibacter sp. TaxID=2053492 RepID=UPI002FC317C9
MQTILISRLTLAAAWLFVGNSVFAHDDAALDKVKGTHGGQLRMAGSYHFELVVVSDNKEGKDKPVAVYLTDHGDQKVSAAGTTGTATLLASKARSTVALTPAGDNKLAGVGQYASDPQMKVVVSVSFPDGKTLQARFTPMATAAADGH